MSKEAYAFYLLIEIKLDSAIFFFTYVSPLCCSFDVVFRAAALANLTESETNRKFLNQLNEIKGSVSEAVLQLLCPYNCVYCQETDQSADTFRTGDCPVLVFVFLHSWFSGDEKVI